MANCLHHPPDLPVAPLVDRHLHDGRSLFDARPQLLYFGRRGRLTAPDTQAARQPLERILGRASLNRHMVRFTQTLRGMRHPKYKVSIVGEQNQPLGIGIETPRRNEADTGNAHKIGDLTRRMAVGNRRDVANRLIQRHIIAPNFGDDPFAVHLDPLTFRIDQRPLFGDNFTVNPDPAGRYHLLGVPPRGYSGGGERFLQTLLHNGILPEARGRRPPRLPLSPA